MSSKYRRQSIILKRKSLSRANSKSTDQYDDWNYDGDHDYVSGVANLAGGSYPWFYGGAGIGGAGSAISPYCSGSIAPGTAIVQFGSPSTMTTATLQAIQAQIPPPNLETMKVIKGFEFVTFTPVAIDPPPLSDNGYCIQPFSGLSNVGTLSSKDHHHPPSTELSSLRLSPILTSARSPSTSSLTSISEKQSPALVNRSSLLNISAERSPDSETTMVKSFNVDRMPENIRVNEITESEARDSLFSYVGDKFCYGTKAALQMTIQDMFHSYIFQYSLESFCEKRELCWSYEPYDSDCPVLSETPVGRINSELINPTGDMNSIDEQSLLFLSSSATSPSSSLSSPSTTTSLPNAWNIEIDELKYIHKHCNQKQPNTRTNQKQTSVKTIAGTNQINTQDFGTTRPNGMAKLFKDKQIEAIVPGTISIQSCHNCGGIGRKRCTVCAASGSKSCQTCHGNGFYYGYYHKSEITKTFESSPTADYNNCWRCHGRGRLRCFTCNGEGMLMCAACFGSGQIRCYIKLIVTLTNHEDSVLIQDQYSDDIPLDLLSLVDGDIIFEEKGHNLCHITNFIDDSITRESLRLTQFHKDNYLRNSRLILQRHRIKVIPIAKVLATWQRKNFHFYVFGSERKCYTGNYPQRYSCSCCCVV